MWILMRLSRPNRISLATVVRDLDPPFLEDDLTQLTIMIDVVHPVVTVHVVMPIVIAAHLAVAITMMTVVVMVAHHHLDPVVPSTITHHHVAVASMIPIVVITLRLTHISMDMEDHLMIVLRQEITHPEMPDMLMTDTVVAATGKSSFPNRLQRCDHLDSAHTT